MPKLLAASNDIGIPQYSNRVANKIDVHNLVTYGDNNYNTSNNEILHIMDKPAFKKNKLPIVVSILKDVSDTKAIILGIFDKMHQKFMAKEKRVIEKSDHKFATYQSQYDAK